jgi:hypothetical protein
MAPMRDFGMVEASPAQRNGIASQSREDEWRRPTAGKRAKLDKVSAHPKLSP